MQYKNTIYVMTPLQVQGRFPPSCKPLQLQRQPQHAAWCFQVAGLPRSQGASATAQAARPGRLEQADDDCFAWSKYEARLDCALLRRLSFAPS